ncbi:MAG: hypothetical protein HC927_01245 [Deltaproteobacteria bacterium]|nr:hypothetical protein [Deltaproteobacteria bacterium]
MGRPLGAGIGAVDLFEIVELSMFRERTQVKAAWLRGEGAVTIAERASSPRPSRNPVVPRSEENRGIWSVPVGGTDTTTFGGDTAGQSVDVAPFLSTFNLDILGDINVFVRSSVELVPRLSIYRVTFEAVWRPAGPVVTPGAVLSTLVSGPPVPHTIDINAIGTNNSTFELLLTQSGAGTLEWTWSGLYWATFRP